MADHWSDLFGRKRLYLLGALLAGAFGFVYFTLLNAAVPGWMFVAIVLSYVPRDLLYGPMAAWDAGDLLISEGSPRENKKKRWFLLQKCVKTA